MKRTWTWVWIGVFLLASLGCKGPKDTKATRVTVPGNLTWTKTSVEVKPGQKLKITAEGTLQGGQWRFGPEGASGHQEWANYSVVREWPHLALIGKIGEDGDPFLVGPFYSSTAMRGGVLYLGINDRDAQNNGGSFSVTVVAE